MKKGVKVWGLIAVLIVVGSLFMGIVSTEVIVAAVNKDIAATNVNVTPTSPKGDLELVRGDYETDTSTKNKTEWIKVTPTSTHDMVVTNVNTTPSSPDLEQPTVIHVTVTNEGEQQEDNVSVKVYVDSAQIGSTQYISLAPGSSNTTTFLWSPTTAKAYSVKGEVEIVNGEIDVKDNTKSIKVRVSAVPTPMPGTPSNPSPSNHTTDVYINTNLDWSDCSNTDFYDVYFGTYTHPPYYGNAPTSNYPFQNDLEYGTKYYWKIEAKSNGGGNTSGPIWDFNIEEAPNQPPTAIIDSITPDPAEQGTDTVSFTGHGADLDGTVEAYNWSSSIDGQLSTSAAFTKPASELSVGTHTIYFKVQDNDGAWSTEDTADLTIYPGPELSYSPESRDFCDKREGETDNTTFEIWNSGTDTLTYSLSETCDWLEVNPTSGSSTGEHNTITVDIDTTGLFEGSHTGDIKINSNDGSGTFTVMVNVVPCPESSWRYKVCKWTYMVYLDGDNNLEGAGIDDFMEMSAVGSTSDVNIVVQFDRIPGYVSSYGGWTTCKRFHVTSGMTPTAANALIDLGECNMGDPNTLRDFVEWTMTEFPADNYALILWNHGDGWKSINAWVPWADDIKDAKDAGLTRGICVDNTNNDYLSLQETEQALTGKYVQLLGYDACLMHMIEVVYQVMSNAGVSVGSEEVEPWDGWPYDTILNDLTVTPTMNEYVLGTVIVDRYMASYPTYNDLTQSAMDNSALPNLVTAVDNLAQALMTEINAGHVAQVQQARNAAEEIYYAYYIDLYHFAEMIQLYVPGAAMQAQAVMNSVGVAVYDEAHGSSVPNDHGLSIYYPRNKGDYLASYDNTAFASDTQWDEFLKKYYAPTICGNMGVNSTSWSTTVNCSKTDNEIVTVSATGGSVKGVTVGKISGPTWLSVSPTDLGDIASGSSKTFTMTASPPSETSGDFGYTIRVSNTCGTPSTRDVSGTINVSCPCGNMGVNSTSWSPTLNCSESDNEIVTVSATGGTVKGVTVSKVSGPTWLSVSPTDLGDIASGSSKTFTMTTSPPSGTSGDFPYTVTVSNTCGNPSSIDVTGTIHVDCPESSWTYMVYLDGDNNLEGAGINDFMEMSSVGSTSDVNIVVQFDRIPGYVSSYGDWTDCKRFHVTAGMTPMPANATEDLGECNMGDPNTLKNFVTWAMTDFPADNYALVLWNHGDGWKSINDWVPWADDIKDAKDAGLSRGICVDITNNDYLSLQETEQALTGKYVNLLGYDACLMHMIEVVYQVMANAGVSVGSEESEPGDGWPYDMILADLTVTPAMNDDALGTVIVDRYMDSYGYTGSVTQSAVTNALLPGLATAVDNLAQALITEINAGHVADVQQARNAAAEIYYNYYIDLYHFAEMVDTYVPGAAAQAQAVMNEVSGSMYEAHGTSVPNDHGLSIYYPRVEGDYSASYDSTAFAIDTTWDEFLMKYYNPPTQGEDIAVYSNGWWFVDTTRDHIADQVFLYGAPGNTPIVGDINQFGTDDLAVFSDGLWFVDTTGNHRADLVFLYGAPGSIPVVGDVNQDGDDDSVIFSNGWWFVDTTGNHIADLVFLYGGPGNTPVVGDVNQDGTDDTAVFSDGLWFVDTTGNHVADLVFLYGGPGNTPVVGDVNQDGTDDTAVFSDGLWFVDTTGNHIADLVFLYGAPGSVPVVGNIG